MRIFTDHKVSGSIRTAVNRHWDHRVEKDFYHQKCIIDKDNFDLMWWDGIEGAMKSFPKLYRNWLTKQVADFSSNNLQQAYWVREEDEESQTPLCPCCNSWIESTMHMTRCPAPG